MDRAKHSPNARGVWRFLRSRWTLLGAGAAALLLGAGWLLYRSPQVTAAAKSRLDSYKVHDRLVRFLHEEHPRIGIVLREGVDEKGLHDLLPPGTTPERNLSGRLNCISISTAQVTGKLARFARNLFDRDPKDKDQKHANIAHAGVLLWPEGSKEPLLLTHEFVVRFQPAATEAQIAEILLRHGVDEVCRSQTLDRTRVLAVRADSDVDSLEQCQLFAKEPLVDWAEPNFVHQVEYQSHDPNDPLFPQQWHLKNTGQDLGTADADIDAPEAWDLTKGGSDIVIAILEDGFDDSHPDLAPNLWSDPDHPEQHGHSFEENDATALGDPTDHAAMAHGTAVAGCAAARGDNGLGVTGSCPECSLMLLRRGKTYYQDSEAISYAWTHRADIISGSWIYPLGHEVPQAVRDALTEAAEKGRDGKGCVILFCVINQNIEIDKLDPPGVVTLPEVLGVGAVTNTDARTTVCGVGPSVDLLGPTRLNKAPNGTQGTLNVATTDWQGTAEGYNSDPAMKVKMDDGFLPCEELGASADAANYTLCFGGTSAATPIVAGVAGLILSADPDLTRVEVVRLLQDTADRTEDSQAVYSPINGRSTKETHGNGRVNAFEAVRVVAPRASSGRGGVDVFVRDHRLDWGNTEQPSSLLFEPLKRGVIGPWQSPDIKVDAPPFAAAAPGAANFDAWVDEDPIPGQTNRVYVRVRNRGPKPAADVAVRLLRTPGGTALPPLPNDFWTAFPGESHQPSPWTSVGLVRIPTIATSGASLAGTLEDAAAVAAFEIALEPRDEPDDGLLGLLVVVDCAADPVSNASRASFIPGDIVPWDNNVACRNVRLPGRGHEVPGPAAIAFPVRNPFGDSIQVVLEFVMPVESLVRIDCLADPAPAGEEPLGVPREVTAPNAGPPWPPGELARGQILGKPFLVAGGSELPVRWTCLKPGRGGSLEVRAWQQVGDERTLLLGGVVFGPAAAP